jgi:hypothetical protein
MLRSFKLFQNDKLYMQTRSICPTLGYIKIGFYIHSKIVLEETSKYIFNIRNWFSIMHIKTIDPQFRKF